jgi:crotonobetainyl-CoA:carnitine CoA-transferase CaiB-like acyl-CoA transferase
VVKVEPPRGDWAREIGVFDPRLGMTATFASLNRNKRGICIDLAVAEGVELAGALAQQADIVIEAFRPGVMERLGLGYEALAAGHPGLIYCSISGYGQTGPNTGLPASDSVMQAYGGLMSVVGEEGGEPLRVANIVSDMLAGTNAFAAVLMALYARQSSGRGRQVSTSLLDSIVAFQSTILSEYLVTGALPVRRGNRHPLVAPASVFEVTDGHVAFSVLDHHWRKFCEAMNMQDMTDDPRFHTSAARLANRAALLERLQDAVRARRSAEVIALLGMAGILCAPVQDYRALLADPQVRHNGLIGQLPTDDGGLFPVIKSPMDVGAETRPATVAPALGEHSVDILTRELGLTADHITDLLDRSVVLARGLATH